MSTATDTNHIPTDDEVKASSSRQAWRCANGKVCRGSEDEGTLETREKLTGRLRRVGIHEGHFTRDGKEKRVYQIEADIETANGMERIKASLCNLKGEDAPSGVAIGLAWGLLQIAKDELMVITATQGTKKNEFGSYSTFCNVFTLKPGSTTATEVPRRQRSEEPMEDTLAGLLAEIKTHPAYADRPVNESDDAEGNAQTHLSALCKECEAKQWPTPEQAPAEWLGMMAAVSKQPVKGSLAEISDDLWGQVRLTLKDKVDAPKALAPAVARLAGTGIDAGALD